MRSFDFPIPATSFLGSEGILVEKGAHRRGARVYVAQFSEPKVVSLVSARPRLNCAGTTLDEVKVIFKPRLALNAFSLMDSFAVTETDHSSAGLEMNHTRSAFLIQQAKKTMTACALFPIHKQMSSLSASQSHPQPHLRTCARNGSPKYTTTALVYRV